MIALGSDGGYMMQAARETLARASAGLERVRQWAA